MKVNRTKNYLASTVICVCLLLMAITGKSLFLYAAIGISILLLHKPEIVFAAYFVSSLSVGYFSAGTLGAARFLSVVLIVSLIIQWRKFDKISPLLLFLEVLIILYSLFSCLFSVTGEVYSFMIMMQSLLVAFLLQRSVTIDSESLIHIVILNSLVVILVLFIHMLQDTAIVLGDRYSGTEGVNANKFAMMCTQLGAVMLCAFGFLRNKILKIVCVVAFGLSIAMIVLSGSRSALIGLVAATVLFVVIQGAGVKKTVLSILMIVVVAYIMASYLFTIDSPVINRFDAEVVLEGKGTSRLDFAQIIIDEVISTHLLFGVGMGGQNIMALGIPKQAHNIIIDPLSQLGLIGFILYLCFIIPIIVKSFRVRKKNTLVFLPLTLFVAGLFNGIGEVVFYEKFFWNSIAMCALIVSQSKMHTSPSTNVVNLS